MATHYTRTVVAGGQNVRYDFDLFTGVCKSTTRFRAAKCAEGKNQVALNFNDLTAEDCEALAAMFAATAQELRGNE